MRIYRISSNSQKVEVIVLRRSFVIQFREDIKAEFEEQLFVGTRYENLYYKSKSKNFLVIN